MRVFSVLMFWWTMLDLVIVGVACVFVLVKRARRG
jgi:hypothetical protein